MNVVVVFVEGGTDGVNRKRESAGNKVGLENNLQTDIVINCKWILVWHRLMMCIAEEKNILLNRVKPSASQIPDIPIHRIQVMCQAVESCQTSISLVRTCPCIFSGLNRRLGIFRIFTAVSSMPPQFNTNKPVDTLDG